MNEKEYRNKISSILKTREEILQAALKEIKYKQEKPSIHRLGLFTFLFLAWLFVMFLVYKP
jgi:hypothetical protein